MKKKKFHYIFIAFLIGFCLERVWAGSSVQPAHVVILPPLIVPLNCLREERSFFSSSLNE